MHWIKENSKSWIKLYLALSKKLLAERITHKCKKIFKSLNDFNNMKKKMVFYLILFLIFHDTMSHMMKSKKSLKSKQTSWKKTMLTVKKNSIFIDKFTSSFVCEFILNHYSHRLKGNVARIFFFSGRPVSSDYSNEKA